MNNTVTALRSYSCTSPGMLLCGGDSLQVWCSIKPFSQSRYKVPSKCFRYYAVQSTYATTTNNPTPTTTDAQDEGGPAAQEDAGDAEELERPGDDVRAREGKEGEAGGHDAPLRAAHAPEGAHARGEGKVDKTRGTKDVIRGFPECYDMCRHVRRQRGWTSLRGDQFVVLWVGGSACRHRRRRPEGRTLAIRRDPLRMTRVGGGHQEDMAGAEQYEEPC